MNTNKITFTNSQKKAFGLIQDFLDSEYPVFILKGYAGTGKTFLIAEIVKYLRLIKTEVYLAAPTGRAARIVAQKTNYDARTIHSFIYSGVDEVGDDEEDFVWNFNTKRNRDSLNCVYIIDESSMISDTPASDYFIKFGTGRVLKDFFTYTGIIGSSEEEGNNRKIIFVGDPAQLPPVNTTLSPALSPDHLYDNYGIESHETEMRDVVRQSKESGILKNATRIRECISDEDYSWLKMEEGYDVTNLDFNGEAGGYFEEKLNNPDTLLITATNRNALKYNKAVRNYLFENHRDEIQVGDRLLVVSNNYYYGLMNGDLATVMNIHSETEKIPVKLRNTQQELNLSFRDITLRLDGPKSSLFDCKIVENLLNSTERGLSSAEATALSICARRQLDVPFPDKRLRRSNPSEYRKQQREYFIKLRESEYYNALQVKYGYALTCHKAQGGEWENVIVDFSSFHRKESEEYFRWVYTAISRASGKLFLINPPRIE